MNIIRTTKPTGIAEGISVESVLAPRRPIAPHPQTSSSTRTRLDIKLYEDSPGYIRFLPDKKACKASLSYVGNTEDGNCHVTLVPSVGNGESNGKGNAVAAFAASVTCDDTEAVYSIEQDGDGAMTVVERLQEDYGPELDPLDKMPPEERALLKARLAAPGGTLTTSRLQGKVANQLRYLGKRFLIENHDEDHVHRDLQGNVVIDLLVLYRAHAECRNANLARGCMRTATTQSSILSRINLTVTETNDVYSLSGVNVALRLVHVAYDSYVEATTDAFSVVLGDLQSNNNDGKLDQAHTLRTTYGSDVVALIIDGSQYCGIGYLGPSTNYMFSVTAWNCATGYYSFGHEIGHTL